jgi:DNA-binding transcriptional LysR family regulator
MKLQHIRAFCAVADQNMSISRAARELHTTQPAISKQVRQLEDSLGAVLLIRSKSRILGLTDVGEKVLRCARAVVASTQDIVHIVGDHQRNHDGRLAIATTHTHARYALQDIIPAFSRRHPEVALNLIQSTPVEIADLVATGQVDLGICTLPPVLPRAVAAIPCYELQHVLVGARAHPVFKQRRLSLAAISAYPFITYSEQHAIGRHVLDVFEAAGMPLKIAVRGTDVEIMKYYASSGMGLAIIPLIAYSKTRDRQLAARGVDDLFAISSVYVMARRGAYWPRHLYEFVQNLTPALTADRIEAALLGAAD